MRGEERGAAADAAGISVAVLTEGGGNIGLGHVSRCHSLCQAFRRYSIIPRILLHGDAAAAVFSGEAELCDWLSRPDEAAGMLGVPDLIVFDSVLAGDEVITFLSRNASVSASIDDYNRRDYTGGVVIDWTIGVETAPCYRERHPDVTYLLGAPYITLREPFWRNSPPKAFPQDLETILVTFGGSDTANLTPMVLAMLAEDWPRARKLVVIGPAFARMDVPGAADHLTEMVVSADANRMREVMAQADVAVCAGGQTLYELARMGTPAVAVAVADNQTEDIEGWCGRGSTLYAGKAGEPYVMNTIRRHLNSLADPVARRGMAAQGMKAVDGQGAWRVASALVGATLRAKRQGAARRGGTR